MMMRSSSSTRAAFLLALSLFPLKPALSQGLRELRVRSCPAADALIGASNDEQPGMVRRRYVAERDTTTLITPVLTGVGVSYLVKFAGVRPTAPLSAQLILTMPRSQVDTSFYPGAMPPLTATLDDSVRLDIAPAQVSQYPEGSSTVGLAAYVSPENLLAIARANVTRFSVASVDMQVTAAGRRYLRALYHAALCTEVSK